ncbi:zincin-like metallopeptidase domain-containing protein [Tatumella sp. UCD-D_suzukii]|uniref:zincin-like metallopeptidase domain-containing protein n=1 Tax=Tatumella sp. UCD-D_suzukii TaxID=1408192 RepID=UPI00047286D9|nr:zincin-like metallopeptidase domain-containing protein [Tatumella sp. UCD-D_suzukii]
MNKDYIEKVASSIIDQLEQGTAPWLKPWEPGQLRLPYNPTTGKEYRGMNSLWLHMQGKEDPRWLTFNQGKEEGANVRKGEKGTHIVYWKFSEERTLKDENGRPVIDDETGKAKKVNVQLERPRSFTAVVFNASQFDGLPPLEARPQRPEPERHALAEKIIENSGAKISHVDGDRAFYSPSRDSITLPARNQFPTSDNYYATALHELGHWTGHPDRLDRDLSHPFGSEGYAREELRAEIASLMLGERMDIGHDPGQHAAYVGSWVKALKEDPREIFRAAADAERIAGFVMGFENEQAQAVNVEQQATQEPPRWTVTQRDSTKENPVTEVLGQTNSATEALTLFRGAVDTSVTDNTTGERVGRTEWVRDGAATEWIPSAELEAHAAIEQMGASIPQRPADMSQQDYQLSEAIALARHYPEPESFSQTLLNRQIQTATKEAFGESVPGIRAGQLPEGWTGEARARPVVVSGDFESGDLEDRDPAPGENPSEWRIEVKNNNQQWEWFANGFTADEADQMAGRLNAISNLSQPVATQSLDDENQPRWTVKERGEVIGTTESAVEALELFFSRPYTSVKDNTTGEDAGRSTWGGAAPQWKPSDNLMSIVNAELAAQKEAPEVAQPEDPKWTGAPVPTAWRYAACEVFDAEMAKTTGNPEYSKGRELANGLSQYEEMSFEPSDREKRILEEKKEHIAMATKWVEQNILLNPAVKDAVYETVRDFGQYTGDEKEDTERRNFLTEMEKKHVVPSVTEPAQAVQHHKPENPMSDRTYLAVPYKEKEAAKAEASKAGFRLQWDKEAKSWFAPAGADLSTMQKWNPDSSRVITETAPDSPKVQLADALRDAGLELDRGQWLDGQRIGDSGPVMDGNLYRVPVKGDREGQRSGAYAAHMEGQVPGAYIENFKTGERINWKADGPIEQLTAEDRARLAKEAQERQNSRDASTQKRYEATADAASALWAESPAATANNDYCKAKGMTNPVGLRVVPDAVSPEAAAKGIVIVKTAKDAKEQREKNPNARVFKAGDLLIPGRDMDGKMWTLQSVNPYFKSLMKGGKKHGLFSVAGADAEGKPIEGVLKAANKSLVIAEGYATADTVSRLTGQPVIVAFDSGNINAVAGGLRERFPNTPMVIAADNDHDAPNRKLPNGQPGVNVGLVKAKEAAERHGAGVAAPSFGKGDKGTDWNDVEKSRGENDARKMLAEQMAIAKRDAAVNAERITTLARQRDMEARNDPTTSADDAHVATEHSRAASLISSASDQKTAVNSTAANAMATGAKTPSASDAKSITDRQTNAMRDTVKKERQDVQYEAENDDKNPAKPASRPRVRRRGHDAGM